MATPKTRKEMVRLKESINIVAPFLESIKAMDHPPKLAIEVNEAALAGWKERLVDLVLE